MCVGEILGAWWCWGAGPRLEPGKGQQMDGRAVQSRNLDMGQVDSEAGGGEASWLLFLE